MSRVQDDSPELSDELVAWIRENAEEQGHRYEKIVAAMEALDPERDAWIEAFFERIQSRGFNFDADRLRQIGAEEIPQKPNRPFKVVF